MFVIKSDNAGAITLEVNLPQGKTNKEILETAESEFSADNENLIKQCYGKIVYVTGRITTHLAMWVGHKLAHVSRLIELFDPKENEYIPVIKH
jgi:hypothetical protein